MPLEMMTTVAPIAMMAKNVASVAVWMRVNEFQKLLTVRPVSGSTCDPASTVSAIASATSTITRPASCRPSRCRRTRRMCREKGESAP
jgi:hypothetical protein